MTVSPLQADFVCLAASSIRSASIRNDLIHNPYLRDSQTNDPTLSGDNHGLRTIAHAQFA